MVLVILLQANKRKYYKPMQHKNFTITSKNSGLKACVGTIRCKP